MEFPVYNYQSTLYNFIPFVINYEYLTNTLGNTSVIMEQFNAVFKNNLKNLIANSSNIELPTLKNLYEEVIMLMKDSLTKTSRVQIAFKKASSGIQSNLSKLHKTHKEQMEEITKRTEEFQKAKKDIEDTQQRISKINQQILTLDEADTVQHFYKLSYKQTHIPKHKKTKAHLQNQLSIVNSKLEYFEQNIEAELVKNKKLCTLLSNELEQIMINATFIDFNLGRKDTEIRSRRDSSYQPMVSSTIEQECIRIQQIPFAQNKELTSKIDIQKIQIDHLLSKLQYD